MHQLENQEYVQGFLDNLETHEPFTVVFLKTDNSIRKLTGILDPRGTRNLLAVPIIIDVDEDENPIYRSFRLDRVIHITKE